MKIYEGLNRSYIDVEREARNYFYSAKNVNKALQSKKMDKLRTEWEKKKPSSIQYNWSDVIA